jgi:hypothetical protein
LPSDKNTYRMRCQNLDGIWSIWRVVEVSKLATPPPPVNQPPADPIIRGADMVTAPAATAPTMTPVPFTFRAIDPDLDELYYVVDWNDDGAVDERLPVTGLVPSGTTVSQTRVWTTAGSYTFKVRAYDLAGLASNWVTHTINITDPAVPPPIDPIITLVLDRYLVRAGEAVEATVEITADYQVDCRVYGLGSTASFTHSGGVTPQTYPFTSSQLFATQVIEARCTPVVSPYTMPTESRTVRVQVVPAIEER